MEGFLEGNGRGVARGGGRQRAYSHRSPPPPIFQNLRGGIGWGVNGGANIVNALGARRRAPSARA